MANIVITCAPKIAPILQKEVKELGYDSQLSGDKAVTLEGTLQDTWKLNFHLRTAHRVLYQLYSFRAQDADALYKKALTFRWEDWLEPNGYLSIDAFVRNESIRDFRYASLRLKDAIADRFYDKSGRRPDSGSEKSGVVFFLHWQNEEANIYLDTTGEPLSKRGYREEGGKAPLQESLAAAIILQSKWNGHTHFINPMCGSGTLIIEAVLMALGKYPGHLRKEDYAFTHIKNFSRSEWNQFRRSFEKPKKELDTLQQFIASDINKFVLSKARRNAERAGVEAFIDFRTGDFTKTRIPDGKGIVVLNPEYGERLGEEEQLRPVYEAIGDFFKQECTGKTGYVFTGNMELAKSIGLRTSAKTPMMNAKIECRLMEYELYEGSKKSKYNNK